MTADTQPLICRRNKSDLLVIAVLCFILAAFPLSIVFLPSHTNQPNSASAVAFLLFYGCLLLFPALYAAWYALRSYVRADANGLRWSNGIVTRQAAWDQVTDYYDLTDSRTRKSGTVQTVNGKFTLILLPHIDDLRETIARNATSARAKGWDVKGLRTEEDWPQVFTGPTRLERALPFVLAPIVVVMVATMYPHPSSQTLREIRSGDPVGIFDIMMLVVRYLPVTIIGTIDVLFFCKQRVPKNMRIVADLQHIRYTDHSKSIEAAWPDVIASYRPTTGFSHGPRVDLITPQGDIFLPTSIRRRLLLLKIIERYAVNSPKKPYIKTKEDEESLNPPEFQARGIHNYHTRSSRAMVYAGLGCCLFGALIVSFMDPGLDGTGSPSFWQCMFPFFVCFLAALPYWKTSIHTTASGVTKLTVFGSRHIAWRDIDDFIYDDKTRFRPVGVKGNGKKIRFHSSISNYTTLIETIKRHCPQLTDDAIPYKNQNSQSQDHHATP